VKDIRRRMSDRHEADLAEWFHGRRTRGSGNQAANPGDGRGNRFTDRFGFCWDGKSTLASSISVTLPMLDKLDEQAHGERSLLPLRFYADERLHVRRDMVVVGMDDFREMLDVIEGR
jgi:hypothetical protein